MDSLVRAFCEVAGPGETGSGSSDSIVLRELLSTSLARGRAAHPDLAVSTEAFARHLARSIGSEPVILLERLAIEDMYFACACAEGVEGAAARFERRFGRIIQRAVARVMSQAADRDEAEQLSRRALLLGSDDGPPKLAKYFGQGPLENWVSVIAIRIAVSLGRSEGTERRLRDQTVGEAAGGLDPEVLYMKGEVGREIETAFENALQRLEDRQRLLLRLYLVSGMSMEDIGKTFDVGHQTVSRWLVKARKSVLSDVRREIGRRLQVSKAELASLVRLVASQLDLSISRLLGPA